MYKMWIAILLGWLLTILCGGCSSAKSVEELELFGEQLEARVQAIQDLGVKGFICGHGTIDKIGSWSTTLDGPLDVTLMWFVEVDPQP